MSKWVVIVAFCESSELSSCLKPEPVNENRGRETMTQSAECRRCKANIIDLRSSLSINLTPTTKRPCSGKSHLLFVRGTRIVRVGDSLHAQRLGCAE